MGSCHLHPLRLCLLGLLLLAGCAQKGGPSAKKVARDPNTLLVYAACSLLPAVESARDEFLAANAGKSVEIQTDEPLKLVRRLEDDEVPDILVCLGESEIGLLEREGYLDGGSRTAVGSVRIAVAVPRGNPDKVDTPGDLAGGRIRTIAMAMPGLTSAGTDGKHELERLELWERIQGKLILEESAYGALEKLAKGEVQAAVVYDPCPRLAGAEGLAGAVEVVCPLSGSEEGTARAYAVVHRRSPNALLAQRLLRILAQQPIPEAQPEPESEADTPETQPPASP